MAQSTRDKLIAHAAALFQERGFNGVGLADILSAAGVPKGSLYHHFPNGKSDLAIAAANWTSSQMIRIIDDAFQPAVDFETGFTTLCYKLAKLYDTYPIWQPCPIAASLFDGPNNGLFRDESARIFDEWVAAMAAHGTRFGLTADQALAEARLGFVALQGSWTLAHARGDSDILRDIPAMLYRAEPGAAAQSS